MQHFGLLYIKFRKDKDSSIKLKYTSLFLNNARVKETNDELVIIFKDRLTLKDLKLFKKYIIEDGYLLEESLIFYRDIETEKLIYKHYKFGKTIIDIDEDGFTVKDMVNSKVKTQFMPLNLVLYKMEDLDLKKEIQRSIYATLSEVED